MDCSPRGGVPSRDAESCLCFTHGTWADITRDVSPSPRGRWSREKGVGTKAVEGEGGPESRHWGFARRRLTPSGTARQVAKGGGAPPFRGFAGRGRRDGSCSWKHPASCSFLRYVPSSLGLHLPLVCLETQYEIKVEGGMVEEGAPSPYDTHTHTRTEMCGCTCVRVLSKQPDGVGTTPRDPRRGPCSLAQFP
uniref:Uncharacterized protein n=1 Tax=Molossus molossus TaxID=27622 RepID=A0A7J8BYL8_MOLMO|nr:hypothetical protein HJG59_010091 [Molossus molossus]